MFLNSYGTRSGIERVRSMRSIPGRVPELSETSSQGFYLSYTSICSFWNVWLHVFLDSEVDQLSGKVIVVTHAPGNFSLSVLSHE